MRTLLALGLATVALLGLAAPARAQSGYYPFCIDPESTDPFSDDFGTPYFINNTLFGAALGIGGTVQTRAECWNGVDTVAVETRGRIGFTIGTEGSVQDNVAGAAVDDHLRLNYGMGDIASGFFPLPGATWGYAQTVTEPAEGGALTRTLFGANAYGTAFQGASDRYFTADTINDGIQARLRIDVIGDAARLSWSLLNTGDAPIRAGLWFGQWVTFLDANGARLPATYVTLPGYKPIERGRRFRRVTNPSLFPPVANFAIDQSNGYGLQIVNSPTADPNGPTGDQTPVDELVVGDNTFLLNAPVSNDATMPDAIVGEDPATGDSDVRVIGIDPDTGFAFDDTAYIQKWTPTLLAAGATRQIVAYYRSTWSQSDYARPYAVVLDSPRVVGVDAAAPTSLNPNPFQIRVVIDNIRGFTTAQQEVDLNNVQVTLSLPQGLTDTATGLSTITRSISIIPRRQQATLDFSVTASAEVTGTQNYTVTVVPNPGVTKVVTGAIQFATTPRLRLRNGANLVGVPWRFTQNNWTEILGLQPETEFQAYRWDPERNEYVIQTNAERGRGTWLITPNDLGLLSLGGEPQQPDDQRTGAPLVQLKPGWNLIANPYNYPITLGEIVGVSGTDARQAVPFGTLAQDGVVDGSLRFWDAEAQTYRSLDSLTGTLQPNVGYWLRVNIQGDVTISFPAVSIPFLPADVRSRRSGWSQTEQRWRLQLTARNNRSLDDENFVGVAGSASESRSLRVYEPPMAPVSGAVALSVVDNVDGKTVDLSQALADRSGKRSWTLKVQSNEDGPVTINWPNLATVPRNVRFRLVDKATGVTRDLRRTSGYTFQATANAVREMTLESEPGAAPRPLIGAVTVSRAGRDRNSALTIGYTLASDATTTVRILQNGREIYVPLRSRADRSGQNTVVWNLRDAANRSVAPGVYHVEIVVEAEAGERLRRLVPVNVVR